MMASTTAQRFATLARAILVAACLLSAQPHVARADDVSLKDRFYSRLAAPMTSIVDGTPFRDGIEGIAKRAEVNLWIDRRVDPTAPIDAGPVGPTVLAAIQKIAAKQNCVVMPVAGVLLVGRQAWVDQTTASILSLKQTGADAIGDVAWDDLTTPSEALAQAVSRLGGDVQVEPLLPHDLWPAISWKLIDRRVAVALVLAQFDRKPQSTQSLSSIESVKATDVGQFTRRYSQGDSANAIRKALGDADPRSRVRAGGGWLTASGTVQAHRAATTAMLLDAGNVAAPDPDRDSFTLKKMSTTAKNAFGQLAQAAQRACVIEPEAEAACEKIVSIEGKDVTLRQLIGMVAEQAGVAAQWQGDTIKISLSKQKN